MNELNRLRLGSVFFAMFWTAFMLWWTGATDTVGSILICLSGAIVGATWYGAMRRWAIRRSLASK